MFKDGKVWMECLSDSPVFVQSKIANILEGVHPLSIWKIIPGSSKVLFDGSLFADHLTKTVHQGYEAVFELSKMCAVRISFVKGWGSDYHRKDPTSTPCWIEVHLNLPLKWLDTVLQEMAPPNVLGITSTS